MSQTLIKHYDLAKNSCSQIYGLGVKELWEIDPQKHHPGKVIHTLGWPLARDTYGGGFIYHWGENLVSVGMVIAGDYPNPTLNPFAELQRYKHHPLLESTFVGGRCLSYGARAVNEGGYQAIPDLTFDGGMLIGCSAGFLNVAQNKGIHYAMESGVIAAEKIFANQPAQYPIALKQSFVGQDLKRARNIRPGFKWGLWPGLIYAAIDSYLFRGKAPWTFRFKADHLATNKAKAINKIIYPKPDGQISFDKLTALQLSNVHHQENQPCHLILKDKQKAIEINWRQYAGLEQFYCPAKVYEYLEDEQGERRLQINASNCIHCKFCDIKDPTQNIKWTPPQGGEGPHYSNM